MEPKLSVVIPHYNGIHHLKTSLSSVYKQTHKNFEVILVDDASTDDSVDFVKKKFPKTKIIQLKENKGFSNAINTGIRNSKGKYVMTLSNDTKFSKDVFKKMIAKLEENKKLGVIGPRVVSFENKLESLGIRYSVSGLSEVNKSMKNRIFAVHDCASIYRKKALEDIKVNNEYYDTYLNVFSNEADIAFMLRMLNWDLAVDPDTTVQHLHGGSYPHASDRSMFFTYRNRILVILKNMSFSFFLKHIIPIVLIQILIIGAYTLKGKLHLILKSYWSLIKNFKSIMQKRKTLQKRKIISDKELLKFMTKKWYISSKSS